MKERCISATGFGFPPYDLTASEFIHYEIQDDEVGVKILEAMLRQYPQTYQYNDDQKPQLYKEFDIKNRDELVRQLTLIEKPDSTELE